MSASRIQSGAASPSPDGDDRARLRAVEDENVLLRVGAVCLVDGRVDPEAVAETVIRRAAARPELAEPLGSSSLSLLGSRPEPPRRVDPAAHVRRTAAAPPGGEAELAAVLAEIWSRRFARGRPPWEVSVVEGVAGGRRTAVVVKGHRSLADERGGAELAALVLAPEVASARPPVRPPPLPLRAAPAEGPLGRALGALVTPLVGRSRELGRILAALAEPGVALERTRELGRRLESLSLVLSTPAPETPFGGALGRTRQIGFVRLSRDALSGVEEALSAPLAEIVLTLVADALGRYLQSRGRVIAGLDLTAIVKHGSGAAEVAALVPLRAGAMPAAARWESIHAALRDPAGRSHLESLEAVASACLTLPSALRQAGATLAYQAANTLCVQARAPRAPLEVGRQRVLAIAPIAPLPWNVGLGFAWLDWGGEDVVVTVNADTGLAPDVASVVRALLAAYIDLTASAGVPAIDPERAPAAS